MMHYSRGILAMREEYRQFARIHRPLGVLYFGPCIIDYITAKFNTKSSHPVTIAARKRVNLHLNHRIAAEAWLVWRLEREKTTSFNTQFRPQRESTMGQM